MGRSLRYTLLCVVLLVISGHCAIAQKKKVALLPIVYNESLEISNVEKAALDGALRSSLSHSSKYELLTRTDFSSILGELDFQSSGFVDDQQRVEIGGMHGADYICLTKLTKEKDNYYIESYLIDVIGGHISSYATALHKIKKSPSIDIWNQVMKDIVADLTRYDMLSRENDTLVDVVDGSPIPFQIIEEKPLFYGCTHDAFSNWLNERLQYPAIAKENGVQGRVVVRFTIDKDGTLSNITVLRGVDPSLDAEAIRVVSESPNWIPGKQRDKKVRVTYTIPVIFRLG